MAEKALEHSVRPSTGEVSGTDPTHSVIAAVEKAHDDLVQSARNTVDEAWLALDEAALTSWAVHEVVTRQAAMVTSGQFSIQVNGMELAARCHRQTVALLVRCRTEANQTKRAKQQVWASARRALDEAIQLKALFVAMRDLSR